MKPWLVLLALAAFCVAPQAHAEQATVVTACGTGSFTPGTQIMSLMDINGVGCSGPGGPVRVVTACGSLPPWGPTPAGSQAYSTVDTTGKGCGFGAGAIVVSSVWSAADAAANAMTLSNGGLTVTPQIAGGWATVRNSISHTSGKLYVEFYNSAVTVAPLWEEFGLASSGFDPTGQLSATNYSVGLWPGGFTRVSTGFTGNYVSTLPSAAQNDVYALAIDFGAGSVWIARNNVWSDGSNPATASLPIVSFTPATVGALFAALCFNSGGGGSLGVWTLQATAASQKYAPPAGFSAWDSGGGGGCTNSLNFSQACNSQYLALGVP